MAQPIRTSHRPRSKGRPLRLSHPPTTARRLLGGASLTTTAVLATVLATAAPALAWTSYIGSNSGGANVRTCASTGCPPISSGAYLYNGQGVDMLCWTDNQWVSPPNSDYSSNRWFLVNSPVGTGYVHSSLVEGQRSVGRC
ncbi:MULTISPECIES: SH3 domain-containing protein [Catenuloplanes]|uniref:Uncharacterized protein YraI n=1 Tax=Catenuloplanes niger TaxID=587534 RepID=A0AAE3ZWG1_9ACTN|nr:SH3 domain-containing protein [Catenuloplanes niger]MDR7327334.1 uncharacterized protein YraI [Catenuloplanes niger]